MKTSGKNKKTSRYSYVMAELKTVLKDRGVESKDEEIIEQALELLLRLEKQQRLRELKGKIAFLEDAEEESRLEQD